MRTENRTGKRAALLAGTIVISGALSDPAPAAKWDITPSISGQLNYSDNIALAPSGGESGDAVLEITPRIAAIGKGARIKLNADFSVQSLNYARNSDSNEIWYNLRAGANAELVENFLYLDARAYMQPQAIRAVSGRYPVDIINITGDRTQTAGLSISPSIRGETPDGFRYDLSYLMRVSDADTNQVGGLGQGQWNARIGRSDAFGPLGWGAYYFSSTERYDNRSNTSSDRYGASLNYRVNAQLRLTGSAGRESNDYAGNTSKTNYGAGVDWTPTPRTTIGARADRRFFGTGYELRFNHRTSRSAFNLLATRDVTTNSQTVLDSITVAVLPPPFDQLAASITDPAAQQAFIQLLIDQGIAGLANVQQAFVSDRLLIANRLSGSYALRGARNTLTVTFNRQVSESAVSGGGISDDLTGATEVVTNNAGINLSHSLTRLTSLSASANYYNSKRDAAGSPSTKLQRYNLTLSSRLGVHTSGALGMRHGRSRATTGDYSENAVYGSLTYTF